MTVGHADRNLDVVLLPVSDVDRSEEFHKGLRRREDADTVASDDLRIVQPTPPGSGASISFGTGVPTMTPGSQQGRLLVTDDIEAARRERVERGTPVSEVFHGAAGRFPWSRASGCQGGIPTARATPSHAVFSDPDGNGWVLQKVTQRLPGR